MTQRKSSTKPKAKRKSRKPAVEIIGADGLTDKQRVFVEQYLICWNASEAARLAGYSEKSARSIGSENLTKPNIQELIEQRIATMALSADEVLARLSDLANADMSDFISLSEQGFKIDLKKARDLGRTHLIRKIRQDQNGIQIELHDAKDALIQLGRHHGLFTDVIAGEIETLTPEQIEQRRQERWAKAAPLLAMALHKSNSGEATNDS